MRFHSRRTDPESELAPYPPAPILPLGMPRVWKVLILFVTVVLVGDVLLTVGLFRLDQQRSQSVQERIVAETAQCERVQALRERVNMNGATIYLVLRQAAEAAAVRESRRRYRQLISEVKYERPTDCRRAVLMPDVYRQSETVPFSPRLAESVLAGTTS